MSRYGWIKDEFNPKAVYHKAKAVKLPDVVDLSQFCPTVRDQGQVGSCTGHGVGGALTGTFIQKAIFTEWESVNWIYNGARKIEGTLNQDNGAMPDDCFQWLTDNGSLLEHFFPYKSVLSTDDPNIYKVYAVILNNFQTVRVDNGINGIMSALADGHLVAIGTPWFDTWELQSGILPPIDSKSNVVGGHETFLYGYDITKGIVLGQNSWGTGWGMNGCYTMPMQAFQVFKDMQNQWGGYDAHYVDFTATPTPPPVPPVPPEPSWLVKAIKKLIAWIKGLFK